MAMESEPMSLDAGREFASWLEGLDRSLNDLLATRSVPSLTGLDTLIPLTRRLSAGVRENVAQAAAAGQSRFSMNVPFSDAELRTVSDLGEAVFGWLEVLTVQGKFDATMSPGVEEALTAMAAVFTTGQVTTGRTDAAAARLTRS